jgi:hypothetical protein
MELECLQQCIVFGTVHIIHCCQSLSCSSDFEWLMVEVVASFSVKLGQCSVVVFVIVGVSGCSGDVIDIVTTSAAGGIRVHG